MRLLRSVSWGAVLLVLSAAALLEREEKRDYYLNAIAEARIRLLELEGH